MFGKILAPTGIRVKSEYKISLNIKLNFGYKLSYTKNYSIGSSFGTFKVINFFTVTILDKAKPP